MPERKHVVAIFVEHSGLIQNPLEYNIETSMITPADAFSMRFAFDARLYRELRRDARVRVTIDGTPVLDGFIDRRRRSTRDDTIEISGRDRSGRLVQDAAMLVNYTGRRMLDAIKELASPWFTTITVSDARNRNLRRGRGERVPAGREPLVVDARVSKRAGKIHPGAFRWQVIQEIASENGYLVWSSADGKELFVGKPNYSQPANFLIAHPAPGSSTKSTCKELEIVDDDGDRYSLIAVFGSAGGDDADYGDSVVSQLGRATDWPTADGTGRDFLQPKRLFIQKQTDSIGNAQQVAERERARRDFRRTVVNALMPGHGQHIKVTAPTIFAINTIARVLDEEQSPAWDEDCAIVSCAYRGNRSGAEETQIELVPRGTEIVL